MALVESNRKFAVLILFILISSLSTFLPTITEAALSTGVSSDTDRAKTFIIERVKAHILQKLGMQSMPDLNATTLKNVLSKQALESIINDENGRVDKKRESSRLVRAIEEGRRGRYKRGDDYTHYRIKELFVFALDKNECSERINDPKIICLKLPLDSTTPDTIVSASLWVNLRKTMGEMVLAKLHEITADELQSSVRLAPGERGPWFKFDLRLEVLEKWRKSKTGTKHLLKVSLSCPTCSEDDFDEDAPPLLYIRQRTSAPGTSAVSRDDDLCKQNQTTCCREVHEISVSDLGWSNWVLFPNSLVLGVCKNSCGRGSLGDVLADSGHLPKTSACCTPVSYSDLTMVFIDNSKVLRMEDIKDVVTDRCQCA